MVLVELGLYANQLRIHRTVGEARQPARRRHLPNHQLVQFPNASVGRIHYGIGPRFERTPDIWRMDVDHQQSFRYALQPTAYTAPTERIYPHFLHLESSRDCGVRQWRPGSHEFTQLLPGDRKSTRL